MVSNVVKVLNVYSECSLYPTLLCLGYVSGPESLSLLIFVWCPQLLQNWRYSDSVINHYRNPTYTKPKLLELAHPGSNFTDFLICYIGRP